MRNKLRKHSAFDTIAPLLEQINIKLVDIRKEELSNSVFYQIVITNSEHNCGIDECAKTHKLLRPRLSILENDSDIDMEVTTPGIQRNFRDFYEFSVFLNRPVRIYDNKISAWLEGILTDVKEDEVTLHNAVIEDTKDIIDEYRIPNDRIQKAKLAYAWENM
ncbi:MAG: ribosome assembly cofactor RimP [Spirochaetia bacterium]|nr:ribosome assembly cofactor RimP [Spirochaetia bacterium]